jgi:hypothetical protein
LLDSNEALKYGPFIRLLDVYWSNIRLSHVQAIRSELLETLAFINERPLRRELRQ